MKTRSSVRPACHGGTDPSKSTARSDSNLTVFVGFSCKATRSENRQPADVYPLKVVDRMFMAQLAKSRVRVRSTIFLHQVLDRRPGAVGIAPGFPPAGRGAWSGGIDAPFVNAW
jgi:hypothetical protein